MTKNPTSFDSLLREALQHQQASEPRLSDEAMQRIAARLDAAPSASDSDAVDAMAADGRPVRRAVPLWLRLTAVAAAVLVAFVLGRLTTRESPAPAPQQAHVSVPVERPQTVFLTTVDTVYADRYVAVERQVVVHDTIVLRQPTLEDYYTSGVRDSLAGDGVLLTMKDMESQMRAFAENRPGASFILN